MRPEGNEALDMSSLRTMLAPKDVVAISFERKDNLHGIGYSGIDPYTAMHGNIDKSNTQKAFRPTGNEKRGIRGQVCVLFFITTTKKKRTMHYLCFFIKALKVYI